MMRIVIASALFALPGVCSLGWIRRSSAAFKEFWAIVYFLQKLPIFLIIHLAKGTRMSVPLLYVAECLVEGSLLFTKH